MSSINYKQKSKDFKLGYEGEEQVFKRLQELYGDKVKKYESRYCVKDFYLVNEKGDVIHEWELKTRRVESNTYPSTVFGHNKFEHSIKALRGDVKQTYLFNFVDGLYSWELYDEEVQKEEFEIGICANRRRYDKEHKAVYVFTKFLTRM